MLTNHDQNIQSRFRLLKVCFCIKLEQSVLQDLLCKSARLDRSKLMQIVFLQNFPTLAQAHIICRVLCFALSIKRKTLATFYCCCLCCVCESLVRSRGVCLHTYLGLSRSRLMSRASNRFSCCIKSLKRNTSRSTCGCCDSKKEVVRGLGAVTWSWQ